MFKLKVKFDLEKTANDFVAKFKSADIRGTSIEKIFDKSVIIDSDDKKAYSLVKQFVFDKNNWKSPEQKNKISLLQANKETTKLNAKS